MKSIKLPQAFLANGIHSGLKKKRKDLSLFYSLTPCKIAAVFTSNLVKAAPVQLAVETLKKTDHIRAVLINSGNANCMTGKQGLIDAKKIVKRTAGVLGVKESEVLVSSTGVIGKLLNMRPLISGIKIVAAGLSAEGAIDASDAIMTTDKFRKAVVREFVVGDKTVTMTGIAKGAGMINPNMATMLCYILTDCNITHGALQKALRDSNEKSFNAITVDGDMSTNDTLMLLANGEAQNEIIKENTKEYKIFKKNLDSITMRLAELIVKDGEGATKFVEVKIEGAKNDIDAKKAAESIANSLLTKCAIHGEDPNWGRVAAAVGMSGAEFDPEWLEIILDGITFFKNGRFTEPPLSDISHVFKRKNIKILVKLHYGKGKATVYTCDISKKYITINALYTT